MTAAGTTPVLRSRASPIRSSRGTATSEGTTLSTLSVIVGNPKPHSRTRQIAEELAARLAVVTGAEILPTVDLIDHASQLFSWPAPTLDPIAEQLRASTFAIIATPTYKASYTGLLKAFLDRYPAQGLSGVTAVPVFTIASEEHTLAVDVTLRPLLVELGASVPTQGLAFLTPKFDRRELILDEWVASQGPLLAAIAAAHPRTPHIADTPEATA